MIIEFEGRQRSIDSGKVTIEQAFVIKSSTVDPQYPAGRGLKAWQEGLNDVDPHCLRALYWLMLQQEGTEGPCVGLSFPAISFQNAVVAAIQLQQLAEAEAAARKDQAADNADADGAAGVPPTVPSPGPPSQPTGIPPQLSPSGNGS